MRLLAVDAVYIHSTAEVSELLAKHAVGRAARFELRPAPPAAEEVFAEKKQEKAKQQAAIDAALMAASKPYGKKFEVWEAEEVRNAPRFSASILDRSCQSVDRLSRQARDKSNTNRTQTQKVCGFSALQAEIERAKREKEALTLTVSSSVAETARQEVALMADRPDLQEAQEVLVDWIGERSATQQVRNRGLFSPLI